MAKKKEAPPKEPNLADFVGRKLVDIGHLKEDGPLVIQFDNGYNINVSGNITLKKERRDV